MNRTEFYAKYYANELGIPIPIVKKKKGENTVDGPPSESFASAGFYDPPHLRSGSFAGEKYAAPFEWEIFPIHRMNGGVTDDDRSEPHEHSETDPETDPETDNLNYGTAWQLYGKQLTDIWQNGPHLESTSAFTSSTSAAETII